MRIQAVHMQEHDAEQKEHASHINKQTGPGNALAALRERCA
jgi:hypothetical protein